MMEVPSRWSGSPPSLRRHAPLLGEHSAEVLREVGYSAEDVARLADDGVTLLPRAV